ncbi:unnamed protein product [Camellia sinensis]
MLCYKLLDIIVGIPISITKMLCNILPDIIVSLSISIMNATDDWTWQFPVKSEYNIGFLLSLPPPPARLRGED